MKHIFTKYQFFSSENSDKQIEDSEWLLKQQKETQLMTWIDFN